MSIQREPIVALDFYQEYYKSKLSDYHLSEEQSRYASVPLKAVSECETDGTRHPVVILYDGEPAGFFVLQGWEGVKAYSDNPDAILLRGYSVNANFQGKGIAKESLFALDSFVKRNFPDKKEIILAVNHKNTLAQHVYKKSGFIDKGIRVMGKKGELLIFHKGC
ncbi:GNAT family N-acetyltransferase [Planococcus halotolerans]|uniref:GNAT family N-acetyltransferase n=1 Tax=Planococcus halotolerans TaxID=2233542 RepID=A0A365L0N6_9BACL|nr:GNAT family N-acetyltransferase [Planococcus halotolerans]QHJ71307.1 GNAT family N-acetyltransferase [Planococcus halotolerans]RAZ78932.1 GNAT family N-acetyltransferase [Planococcus halotolerans]